MSTNKTQNYNLHSWVPEDDFLRSEFNDNFTSLDTALKSLSTALAAGLCLARLQKNQKTVTESLSSVDLSKVQ